MGRKHRNQVSAPSPTPSSFIRKTEECLPGAELVELENQFVLRIPEEPARAIRKAIQSGASNLKERLFIQMEPDSGPNTQYLRRGQVQFDGWNLNGIMMDLPTIVESQKTIDGKNFYKTADISQVLICKEGEFKENDETNRQKKEKDPSKVDKKYLHPHGIAPPLKNVKKRRFRKTKDQKYVEGPEVEKEVKRLLREDNEAVSVKWEVITEAELNANKTGEAGQTDNPEVKPSVSGGFTNDPTDLGLDLTDSEDDDNDVDVDSGESGLVSDNKTQDTQDNVSSINTNGPTQFSAEMFNGSSSPKRKNKQEELQKAEMIHLRSKKKELEHNISNCPNEALKRRFRKDLQEVLNDIERMENNGIN